MRTRIGVVGVVVLLGVLMAATVAPEAVGNILVSLSVLVFVWAVVGLIKPRWGHIPNRMASVWVWAISVGLFTAGALISDPPDQTVDKAGNATFLESVSDSQPIQEPTIPDDVSYFDHRFNCHSGHQTQPRRSVEQKSC